MMEKLLREIVMDHLIKHALLSDKQHSFINGRSTTTQLLVYLDICTRSIVDGHVIDVIYLDLWKAFDTVPHQRLLKKLASYGLKGSILQWIKVFLTGRTQEVILNGVKSRHAPVVSSFKFQIYLVNDIPS